MTAYTAMHMYVHVRTHTHTYTYVTIVRRESAIVKDANECYLTSSLQSVQLGACFFFLRVE